MALALEVTTNSTSRIGQRFGGRDHSTVIHAICKTAALTQADQQIASDLAELRSGLSIPTNDDDFPLEVRPRLEPEHMSPEIHIP